MWGGGAASPPGKEQGHNFRGESFVLPSFLQGIYELFDSFAVLFLLLWMSPVSTITFEPFGLNHLYFLELFLQFFVIFDKVSLPPSFLTLVFNVPGARCRSSRTAVFTHKNSHAFWEFGKKEFVSKRRAGLQGPGCLHAGQTGYMAYLARYRRQAAVCLSRWCRCGHRGHWP